MNGIFLLLCTELLDTPCLYSATAIREVTQTEPRLSTHNPEVTMVITDKLCPAGLLFICLYGGEVAPLSSVERLRMM